MADGETTTSLWEEIVDALNAVNGSHAGHRAVHAKGMVCEGTFAASPEAARLSRAAHLQGDEVRAIVRFSNASGNPRTSDANPIAGRGIGVKLHLPDGEAVDMGAVPLPVFMVSTPEDFLEFTRARIPDPDTGEADPQKLIEFVTAHPETATALQLGLPKLAPTTSFATSAYNGLHAFGLVSADGETTWGRYSWVPVAGERYLSDEERGAADRDYLRQELGERLASGTAEFDLVFTLAAEGDTLTDPTRPWEGEREQVVLGRLAVTGVVDEADAAGGGPLVFDPNNLTDGIVASDDPILAARSPAYSVSIDRRMASGG
ncbi:MAG TPA: catalase family peroxidase [Solirubrobacterales bacterium]|jgi:catalase|nr:catalase family peroxidase [Solirubrobacterales bacterium]